MAITGPLPSFCESQGTCCCGGHANPNTCIPFTGVGQPCSAGAMCTIDEEGGPSCHCDAASGTWFCNPRYPLDMVPYPPLDMTAHD